MGNTAAALKQAGYNVSGSDQGIYSPMKEYLEQHHVTVKSPYSPDNPGNPDLIIVGNALSRGNVELEEILNRNLSCTSLPEFLRWTVLRNRKNLVITGTHGKTTTTAMLTVVLAEAGLNPGYMLGGVPIDLPGGFSPGEGEYFAIEGDEYDTAYFDKRAKFLQYLPFGVIINNIEFDHGDIYNSLDEILDSFRKLLKLIPQNGRLVVNGDDENIMKILDESRCPIVRFGLNEKNDFNGELSEGILSITKHGNVWGECRFKPLGVHNLLNALAVTALLDSLGMEKDLILQGLSKFTGVKRRLEFIGEYQRDILLYDDFAHHPTAVKITLETLRRAYPARRIWAAFEPRSNTSVTNRFQNEWIEAFRPADIIVIAGLHRREKIPVDKRLNIDMLISELKKEGKKSYFIPAPNMIADEITSKAEPGDVIVVMSNGGFGGLLGMLKERLL
ncbi:hypothetical protein ISS30_07685 [bacterium]|nr:hypothetical protein [bacterium]